MCFARLPQVVNFLARISRSLSISPLLGGARGPYIRDEHRSIATAYFESPGTLDMKVCLAVIRMERWRQGLPIPARPCAMAVVEPY